MSRRIETLFLLSILKSIPTTPYILWAMDVGIRRHMENPGGSSMIGVRSFRRDGRSVHLLFDCNTLLAAMTLQRIGKRIYIKNVDTTGCGVGHTRSFIIAVLKTISPDMTCCFSSPRNEYIFNKSSLNRMKKTRGPGDLLEYWVATFEEIHDKVYVWSNHYENVSHPFKDIDELVYFEDDPKEKLAKHFKGNLGEMFAALLCRTDFTAGSLVYGKSFGNVECYFDLLDAEDVDIGYVEMFLRSLDFSNAERAKMSTERFVCAFDIELEYFMSEKKSSTREETHACVLSTRRK